MTVPDSQRDPLDIVTDHVMEAMALPRGRRRRNRMAFLAEVHLAMTVGHWRQYRTELAEERAKLEQALEQIKRLRRAQIYGTSGRCRTCSGFEGGHYMRCSHYIGPLTHEMSFLDVNGTFGGADYYCTCGGWFRQGGLAGHGDGSDTAEVVCPNASETWRGPREGDSSGS